MGKVVYLSGAVSEAYSRNALDYIRKFGGEINSANHRIDVVNAVRIQQGKPVLSHYSTDISNYRLNFAVIGGEIAAQRPITGHMGARFREWNIFIQR